MYQTTEEKVRHREGRDNIISLDWSQLSDKKIAGYFQHPSPIMVKAALASLIDRYGDDLWSFIYAELDGHQQDAEDAYGDTWLVVLEQCHTFVWRENAKTHNPLRSWLFSIALNRIRDIRHIRRSKREHETPTPFDDVAEHLTTYSSTSRLPEADATATDIPAPWQSKLKPEENGLFRLLLANFSYKTIAEEIGISKGAAKQRVRRLRKKLQSMFLDQEAKRLQYDE